MNKLMPSEIEFNTLSEDGASVEATLFTMKVFDEYSASFKSDTIVGYHDIDDFCAAIKEAYFQMFPEHLPKYEKLQSS